LFFLFFIFLPINPFFFNNQRKQKEVEEQVRKETEELREQLKKEQENHETELQELETRFQGIERQRTEQRKAWEMQLANVSAILLCLYSSPLLFYRSYPYFAFSSLP
jgi:uncharacterized protein YlxW (UPF0749 family)